MTYEEFEFCYDQASRDLDDQIDSMQEKVERMGAHRRVLDAARDAFSKYDDLREQVESQQQEIDDLHEQLEAKEGEIASLQRQYQVEIETLQRQYIWSRRSSTWRLRSRLSRWRYTTTSSRAARRRCSTTRCMGSLRS